MNILAHILFCTGGNQREVDRQRSQKRAEKSTSKKKKQSVGNGAQALTNKKEHDAEIMRQKQVEAEKKKTPDTSTDSTKSK